MIYANRQGRSYHRISRVNDTKPPSYRAPTCVTSVPLKLHMLAPIPKKRIPMEFWYIATSELATPVLIGTTKRGVSMIRGPQAYKGPYSPSNRVLIPKKAEQPCRWAYGARSEPPSHIMDVNGARESYESLMSVVQRLWDQYQSEDSVSRRPVPGRPRATTPAEDRFLALSARRRRTTTVPQLVADHFQASGRRISATTVRNRLHNAGLYARRPVVCVPLNGRQRRNRLCWAREHVSWTQQQWASVLFTDDYRGGGILVWAGISLGGHTDLHVFHGGTVTGLRYRDEILDPYVRPYAAAIGNDFILMDDNARPHRARIIEEYLEDHGLERMEWPARSPDLNPIEHLWDYIGREVAALNPPPRSLHELKQGLLCVWSSLPIPVSDNLINSMGNRCRQCIQVRGGHIPY
ncbi:transposable element Tcb2 transposase [Trichonephila clavipes]|uniref:Transposable element Tcb2 transposase n=1 Tax=Trichonephila clavipes TaxID=2585209 RepID=A0A8X6UY86_TRICX|nr:transposable element Tcb2 transposase [Trichonephila clavipes]